MNDDAFEKKLESLAGALPRPDPTPQWKADILARARREANADVGSATTTSAPAHRRLPPRWLMTVWCAAWAVIALLHFSTPADTTSYQSTQLVETKRAVEPRSSTDATDASSLTLLAFHRELSSGATTTRFDIP
ncbi:hypothetical protein DES53_1259 [Roseimicrobium gellanilyticum]|uniref:Uncharacterized protein n=1 Tax=Roseimicrobium gellanilyticum TaxID=748857 RepID=A0A366H0G1_9BACT|nr:hypothetical protein [Roseimicrobium gellanilyticum]RBP35183.1 hypothetical protein DES53_1259 [Roseimicrobium gellanilyticum]